MTWLALLLVAGQWSYGGFTADAPAPVLPAPAPAVPTADYRLRSVGPGGRAWGDYATIGAAISAAQTAWPAGHPFEIHELSTGWKVPLTVPLTLPAHATLVR